MQESARVVYHGTFWELDEAESFVLPSAEYSDLGAVYFSDALGVAQWFTSYNGSAGDRVLVVLRGELSIKAPSVHDAEVLVSNPWVEMGESEYHSGKDREDWYQALQAAGHDALIIEGNYPDQDGGSDIAVFGHPEFVCTGVQMYIDGDWTDWLAPEDAQARFSDLAAANRISHSAGPAASAPSF